MDRKPLQRISDLSEGKIVYNKETGNRYLILGVFGDRATGVSIADITNPKEWEVLQPTTFFTDEDMAGYKPKPKPGSRKFWHG
jgi:hypothetical protein